MSDDDQADDDKVIDLEGWKGRRRRPRPPRMPCKHPLRLRWWSSNIETRKWQTTTNPETGMPRIVEPAGWWCPSCETCWGFPRERADQLDAKPRACNPRGQWAIYLMPDATLTITAGGALTDDEADALDRALGEARRAAATYADQLARRDRWAIAWAGEHLVLSRYVRGWQHACLLVPTRPRLTPKCAVCADQIAAGEPCYRGEKIPIVHRAHRGRLAPLHRWQPAHELEGARNYRVCTTCVARLAGERPVPAPAPERWPIRQLDADPPADPAWPTLATEA